jgi:hypothetical protein
MVDRQLTSVNIMINNPAVRSDFAQQWAAVRSRPHLGALLLGYRTNDGKLTYAGRVGT